LQDIQSWLAELGLEKYSSAFAEAEIQFSDLIDLTEEDLKEVGLPVGPRRRASSAIRAMREIDMPAPVGIATDPIRGCCQTDANQSLQGQ